ncbi:MAG: FAD-binding oxidoreductase [Thermoplasmata archaeon]
MNNKLFALWGEESRSSDSSPKLYEYIYKQFNVNGNNIIWDGYYSPSSLSIDDNLKKQLLNCITEDKISFDVKDRFYHSIGKAASEYIKLMNGEKIEIVDAVIYPTEEQVPSLFKNLGKDIEIVIFGGGSSVTEGLTPKKKKKYSVSLDIKNFRDFKINKESLVLETGTGFTGPELEKKLNSENLTLGHFPESFEHSTIGGWIATNAAGQESNRYGKMKDIVIGVKMITPTGTYTDHPVPAESAFFKVSDLAVGSEGAYGLITKAWLKVNPVPRNRYFHSYMFHSFMDGIEALRDEFRHGNFPMVSRLSDETETALSMLAIKDSFLTNLFKRYLNMRNVLEKSALLILIDDKKRSYKSFKKGVSIGSAPAKFWYKTRYDRPYMYNELLKRGIVAETIETSMLWGSVNTLYNNVIQAFKDATSKNNIQGIIMSHASHEYKSGTALYFTFLFYTEQDKEKVLFLLRSTVLDAILRSGGSISHHHGIGTMLGKELKEYKGETYKLIRLIKENVDPQNIINSGILYD